MDNTLSISNINNIPNVGIIIELDLLGKIYSTKYMEIFVPLEVLSDIKNNKDFEETVQLIIIKSVLQSELDMSKESIQN